MKANMFYCLLISFSSLLNCKALAMSITLTDRDCKMLGPGKGGKILVNNEASRVKTYCNLKSDTLLSCSTINPKTDKMLSSHDYEVGVLKEKGAIFFLLGRSKSGNIRFNFDFSSKTYQWGQTNLLSEGTVVANKFCIGSFNVK